MSWDGPDDFLDRLQKKLIPTFGDMDAPVGGDLHLLDEGQDQKLRDAGVLIGVVDRGENDLNVILTQRPNSMPTHPGQVALPGGKVDPTDQGPVHAALREAKEEVGVEPTSVDLQGRADIYVTGTGFRITPVIGILPPDFIAIPDPHEVDDVFETPLSFLMNPDNHIRKTTNWKGIERSYLEMPHNGRYIWGVTAGVLRALYERLYREDDQT
ncbi:NUDIX hydrolase [Ponticaulis profundi]|uniref:NUDIX hydrolase n=1 Tax=Ponticaulis profundi TaxID=2665222 RepID=A0ABW1SBP3_9PROT